MTTPLWILMVGSIFAGFLWIPHVFLPFEHWLEPVMVHHAAVAEAHEGGVGLEIGLMALSVLVASMGIGLAWLMYAKKSIRPETFSEALGGAPYQLMLNKYWIDELYQATIVRGTLALASLCAWFDANVVDGIVNGAATTVRGISWLSGLWDSYVVDGLVNLVANFTYFIGRRVRNLQTGAINAYLYVILIGVLGGVLLYWSLAVAS